MRMWAGRRTSSSRNQPFTASKCASCRSTSAPHLRGQLYYARSRLRSPWGECLQPARYQFGHFTLDPVGRVLLVDGNEAAITPRAFDLLLVLAERAGQLVSKNDLLELVWPKVIVEENNLQVQISSLRKLLGAE